MHGNFWESRRGGILSSLVQTGEGFLEKPMAGLSLECWLGLGLQKDARQREATELSMGLMLCKKQRVRASWVLGCPWCQGGAVQTSWANSLGWLGEGLSCSLGVWLQDLPSPRSLVYPECTSVG